MIILESHENIILTCDGSLPEYVYIGCRRFNIKLFIPNPTRCWRCQRYGHAEASCHGKLTCPRCAQNHGFGDCPLSKEGREDSRNKAESKCVNCKGNHSAAFKGCPIYLKNKEIVEIKVKNKLTFADAVKKFDEVDRGRNQGETGIKKIEQQGGKG